MPNNLTTPPMTFKEQYNKKILVELAKELGYDAGFGMNSYADDVASYISQEFVRRLSVKKNKI